MITTPALAHLKSEILYSGRRFHPIQCAAFCRHPGKNDRGLLHRALRQHHVLATGQVLAMTIPELLGEESTEKSVFAQSASTAQGHAQHLVLG